MNSRLERNPNELPAHATIVDAVPVLEKMQAGDEKEAGLGIERGIVVVTEIAGGIGIGTETETLAAVEEGETVA